LEHLWRRGETEQRMDVLDPLIGIDVALAG
jgi:hypothetical protein